MSLPFTPEQFLGVFRQYNLAIWPLQVVAYVLGICVVALAVHRTRYSGRAIGGVLAFFWLWTGVAYHIVSFSPINPIARVFGALFVVQGILWLAFLVLRPKLSFRAGTQVIAVVGWVFVLYAAVIYPIIGMLSGHGYPNSPAFGLAPCPTTIFTFGLLLWADAKVPKYLLVIPLLWSLIGFMAALSLGIREDYGLLVAGLVSTALIVWRDQRSTASWAHTDTSPSLPLVGVLGEEQRSSR
jgi:hypothetical protein